MRRVIPSTLFPHRVLFPRPRARANERQRTNERSSDRVVSFAVVVVADAASRSTRANAPPCGARSSSSRDPFSFKKKPGSRSSQDPTSMGGRERRDPRPWSSSVRGRRRVDDSTRRPRRRPRRRLDDAQATRRRTWLRSTITTYTNTRGTNTHPTRWRNGCSRALSIERIARVNVATNELALSVGDVARERGGGFGTVWKRNHGHDDVRRGKQRKGENDDER